MDFCQIKEKEGGTLRKPTIEVFADFKVLRSKDLMVRGKSFYAIWDPEAGLWSTDEYDVQRLVDDEIMKYQVRSDTGGEVVRKFLGNFSSHSWSQFRLYVSSMDDSYTELDQHLTFRNTEVKKEDYVSKRLPYDLVEGDISAWDEIVGTLYDPEERAKIEWAIGAIVAGDSKTIQKFLVFYGSAGTGKSTILNIIMWMFEDYMTTFVSKELTGQNNAFALESFKSNPLLAIEHDGDLSKVVDNSKMNSLVAHEPIQVNEKFKAPYMMRFLAMLMIGTNSPVKITDAKSGLIRRLIDIQPTGKLLSPRKYQSLMSQVKFELGAIAWYCREVYLGMGKDYYAGYRPVEMMLQTDVFFNFIESNYDVFRAQDGVTLVQAYEMYKEFIKESGMEYSLPRHKLREELKSYFEHFEDRAILEDGTRVRSWYSGFNADRFKMPTGKEEHMYSLVMDETESLLDLLLETYPAQYAKDDGTPTKFWDDSPKMKFNERQGKMEEYIPGPRSIVSTTLADLDTTKEHYTKTPENMVVIDFDLEDADGKKSAERNLEKASQWPSTYAEFSKSGDGIHLHYFYDGDVTELANTYEDRIEIKVYRGNSALRRKLSRCNNVPVATLAVGALPLKEKKSMLSSSTINDEKHLRALIEKGLRKDVHPGTKSNIDYIHHVLSQAYKSEMSYDVTDLRPRIIAFANNSSNQALQSLKMVQQMSFKSEDVVVAAAVLPKDERIVLFDVEVFPNLFVVCWKYQGDQASVVKMINPTPQEIEELISMKLVGFNCRRYDNHILYGRLMGYDNEKLYKLSQKIISGARDALFGEAYNISYADIFEFSSIKMSLKKWEIELGIHHMELGIPWDEPVPPEKVALVVKYCGNDVLATDAVFVDRRQDFVARQILADLSGLPINTTTQQHTSKIIFGADSRPQEKFVYTDLSDRFPGYEFGYDPEKKRSVSTYKGEITGEGGLVYAEPGMYTNVILLDVASMHPTSIEELNMFGEEYTKNFSTIKRARMAIKHKDYELAKGMFGGKLARHLGDDEEAEALSYALKIVINTVYGLTSAGFDNAFKDPRNIDNIVAKRGALFMVDLKHACQAKGWQVVHIKTDSIKIPAKPGQEKEIIEFVMEFGDNYGYTFEHEATYEKFCLVNDAVYIAKTLPGRKPAHWEAVGAQFQHPFVFKSLFTNEPITFKDKCETKTVTTSMFLDFSDSEFVNTTENDAMVFSSDGAMPLNKAGMLFIGKAGMFVPIKEGKGGGTLVRQKDDKFYAVGGTKGFKWLEAEMVKDLNKQKDVDNRYYDELVEAAMLQIAKFGDPVWFIGGQVEQEKIAA